jgi:hypothetical protein
MKAPTVDTLLSALPRYEDKWVTISDSQTVGDIINEVLNAHEEFAPFYDEIAPYFDGADVEEISENIYSFLHSNIKYREEKEADQTTALPAGILTRRCGDCKHYSSFSGGILDALNRQGRKIKWNYRFASYDPFNKQPHHVFTVAHDGSREIWIDPTPGAAAQTPVWQVDKKIKISTMALRRNIAGIGIAMTDQNVIYVEPNQLPSGGLEEVSPIDAAVLEQQEADSEVTPELQSAIEVLMHYGVMNEKAEISDAQLTALSQILPEDEFHNVGQARQILNVYIQKGAMMGNIFDDIWRGVKKVTLALPRNAYLSLVALNVFGLATKLKNAIYEADGKTFSQPGQDKVYRKWHSLGGDWKNIRNAINSGSKKPAILGCVECDGTMGYLDGDGRATMGNPAIPAWIAIASAIVAAISPLVHEILNAKKAAGTLPANIDPSTGLPYGVNPGAVPTGSGNILDTILQWAKDNPIAVAGMGVAAYYFISEHQNKKGKRA